MTMTTQKVKGEPIIDNTKTGYTSPLQLFINTNCAHCAKFGGLCRPEDSRGLTPMSLCITLYCNQPPDVGEILKQATEQASKTTQEIAEQTLEEG
jgi:hypothetical protein